MQSNLSKILCGTLVYCTLLHCNPACGQDSYVLLKTGQLLEGYVIRSETKYRVQFENGAAITVDRSEIELHSNSKQKIFEHVQNNSDAFDIQQQIRLVRWCVKYDLLSQAQSLFNQIKTFDIDPALLSHLEQELEAANRRRFSVQNNPAAQAYGNQRIESANEQSSALSTIELEKLIKELPDGVYSHFANHVQSRMIYGCSAANCHDDQSEQMRLNYYAKGRAIPKRMTQRNIQQVLQFVDREDPHQSSILKFSTTAHGGSSGPPWQENSPHFEKLRQWVLQLAKSPATQTTVEVPAGEVLHPNIDPQQFEIDQTASSLAIPPSPVENFNQPKFKPIDPFDPEIFNTKYRLRQNPAGPAKTNGDSSGIPPSPTLPSGDQGATNFPK